MTGPRFTIELVRDAEKDLKRLRPWTDQATRQLLRLEDDPWTGHPLSGVLRGARALEFTLKNGGAYRAVYTIVEEDRIRVELVVGPHENIYQKAERHYRASLGRAEVTE